MKTNDILILLAFCGAGFFAVKMISKNKLNTTSSNLFSGGNQVGLLTDGTYTTPALDNWASVLPTIDTKGTIYL